MVFKSKTFIILVSLF